MIKKETVILILASCCFLLTACSRQGTSTPLTFSNISESAGQPTLDLTEQPSSELKTAFYLDIPADNTVKLSFSRIGGNGTEIVDITENINTITTIIQKINELEFTISSLSNDEMQMKNATVSTIHIYYQDGLCKVFCNRSGWYQYTDHGEQWLEQKGSLDLEQFVADQMGVQLWR